MANVDLTRKYRNCERREENTVGGEFVAVDGETLAIADVAIVAALPANSVLVGVTVVGMGLKAITKITPTIGSVAYPQVTLTAGNSVKPSAVAAPVLSVDTVPVQFVSDVLIDQGRIVVLPRFIDFDLTTGNRVQPA